MSTHNNGHNIKFAQPLINQLLEKLDNKWFNSSFHHDLCASICIEYKKEQWLYVFMPNGIIDDFDNEDFNKFAVSHEDDIIKECKTIEEVITYVNQFLKEAWGA